MVLTKRLVSLLAIGILLTSQLVSATATIYPDSWTETNIQPGKTVTKLFNMTFYNEVDEVCDRGFTSGSNAFLTAWLQNSLPYSFDGNTTIKNFPVTIIIPSDMTSGTYSGSFEYCNATIPVSITVSGTSTAQCNLIVTILGGKERGKAISFDIRDSNYNAKDATVYITRADGTTEMLSCAGGYCTWLIPPVEPGPIVTRFIVADCSPMTRQIDLTGSLTNTTSEVSGGTITVAGPTEASLGETYQFLIIGQSQPLKNSDISIVGPSGYTFSGTTNQYGIIVDSTLKVYGTEVKPDKAGDYTIFIKREGYAPKTYVFKLVRKECPNECCPEGEFISKECTAGNNCVSNKCVPIEKPIMSISCSPKNPNQFEEIKCQLTDTSGSLITGNTQGKLTQGTSIDESIIFTDGVYALSQGFSDPGNFQITAPETVSYKAASYSSTINAPQIPWTIIIIALVGFIVIIIIILWLRRKHGSSPGGEHLETPGVDIESSSYTK